MPLVRISSTHWSPGAIYRTQVESYRKIEIKGSSGYLWFEVTDSDGALREYGNGNDSRVDHNGGTDYQWSFNKATSVDGNTITCSYHHNTAKGVNYLISIKYQGAEMNFLYSSRTDADEVSMYRLSAKSSLSSCTPSIGLLEKLPSENSLAIRNMPPTATACGRSITPTGTPPAATTCSISCANPAASRSSGRAFYPPTR